MKIRSLLCLIVLLSATFAKAQSFTLDCSCLSTQSVLITNACQAVVPDLCQFTNCWRSTLFPPATLTCSQSPPAGTPVGPGVHTIALTISDPNGQQQVCALTFTVNPVPNTMSLLCAPDKTVECGTTWVFDPPVATNVCCPIAGIPDGVFIFVVSTVTNGTCPEIITQTWQAFDGCMNGATCSQKVTVVDTMPPVLNCNCLTNNPLVQIPMTVTNCVDFIPDLCHAAFICAFDACGGFTCTQNPPPFTPVGPGVHPITVTVFDCASNAASCTVNFTVVAPSTGCGGIGCIPPPTGMAGWWPLDESCGATVFADLSGSGNAALVESGGPLCSANSPLAVPGKVAGAAYFYGPTVRGRAPNAPSLNFGAGDFSVDAWVRPVPVGPTSWQPIVDKLTQPTPSTAFGYAVGITNNRVELRVGNGTMTTRQSLNTVNFNNSWNFIAVSVDRAAQTVTFHVNGVNEAPQALAIAGSFNSAVDLLIGGTHDINGPYGELALDEVELFNRAIANAEMTALWTADRFGKCKPIVPCTNSVVSIFCPPDQTASTCSNSAIVPYPLASASTSCGTIVSIVCTPASGSPFPLGITPVTCIATDSQGNTASCTFNVIVTRDVTPPSCPPTSMSITGCPPRMPNFATNGLITDNCTPAGQISMAQSPLPGAVLPPGISAATILACDAAGNCAVCNVTITAVYAGALPVMTCPPSMVVTGYFLCDDRFASAIYPPPQVSNGALVNCTPPSGTSFPPGLPTVVTCTATNACGTNSCTFTVSVANGFTIIPPCTPPPPNMVMWLKFDETTGATAFNAVSGNNGVLANGPTRIPGQFVVNTLSFDGVNDYVQVQPYAAMQFGTGDFSVDAWVKTTTLNNTVRTIVDHREENGGVTRGYSVYLGTNNTLSFQIADGTFINYYSTFAIPPDGRWHLVAVTVKRNDPNGICFYMDGVQDPVPRNPTVRPGSVTAGICYPFRVGSRSSSVTGLFPGSIDEVELFRRALAPAEIKAIYDARCRGKCRISCQAGEGIVLGCWLPPGGGGTTINTIIYNPLPVPATYTYTYVPVTGAGCASPPSFSPATGTVLVPANSYYFPLPQVNVTFPGGLNPGDCACYRLIIETVDGNQRVECDGRFCLPRGLGLGVCTDPLQPVVPLTNLEPATVTFNLSGTGSAPTTLSNARYVVLSPEGVPVGGASVPSLTIPPAGGGTITVPATFAFPEYDPGRFYRLLLEADLDGDGEYEPLGLAQLLNVLPPGSSEPKLEIQRIPGGPIIIVWPDPCAILEVNPNPWNPAGWTPGPVQTSPWSFSPAPGDGGLFIRLRK